MIVKSRNIMPDILMDVFTRIKTEIMRICEHSMLPKELPEEETEEAAFTITMHYLQTMSCYRSGMLTRNMMFCGFNKEIILKVLGRLAYDPWHHPMIEQELELLQKAA